MLQRALHAVEQCACHLEVVKTRGFRARVVERWPKEFDVRRTLLCRTTTKSAIATRSRSKSCPVPLLPLSAPSAAKCWHTQTIPASPGTVSLGAVKSLRNTGIVCSRTTDDGCGAK